MALFRYGDRESLAWSIIATRSVWSGRARVVYFQFTPMENGKSLPRVKSWIIRAFSVISANSDA